MKNKIEGWAIINIGHPAHGKKYIVNHSFKFTRTECIKEFIKGSSRPWHYWKNKYNFRCVRATNEITVNE